MSEGVGYGAHAPATSRSQPAYGEGRLSYEKPPKAEEHLHGGAETALAYAILGPAIAAYGAVGYGIYRAASGLI